MVGLVHRLLLLLGLSTPLACASEGVFTCSNDSNCTGQGSGTCEPTGYCSFPDAECPNGRRYGELAGGGFAGSCVEPDDVATDTTPGTNTDPSNATLTTSGPTSDATTAPDDPSTSTSTTANTNEISESLSDTTDTGSDDTSDDAGLLADGESCSTNGECESGICFLSGILGGICGECSSDADCEFGCDSPTPLTDPPQGSRCNDGGLGSGCDSSTSCVVDGHTCVQVVDIPGILSVSTCSECETSAECGAEVCNVAIDLTSLAGQKTCVPPGSVPDGQFCDLEGDGDAACENHCATADIMGLAQFGVCGGCRTVDGMVEGCSTGRSCSEPVVGLDGAVEASFCQ